MHDAGKIVIAAGLVLVVLGLVMWKTGGLGPLGRLPGDISVKGERGGFYFPVVTCLILSAALTLIVWLSKK